MHQDERRRERSAEIETGTTSAENGFEMNDGSR